jgi:hypothetical protein
MQIFKKIKNNRYTPFSLGTLVAFVMMVSVISCDACRTKGDTTGSPVFNPLTKKTFIGEDDVDVDVTLKCEEEGKEVDFQNYLIKVTVEENGKKVGTSKVKFTSYPDGTETPDTTIQVGADEKDTIQKIAYFFPVDEDLTLPYGKEDLVTKFTFIPAEGVESMQLKIEILDANNNPLGGNSTIVAEWKEEEKEAKFYVQFNAPADKAVFNANDAIDVELEVKVEEDGEAVKLSQIEVELITEDDVTFDIGAKEGVTNKGRITLKDVLGNDDEIDAGKTKPVKFQIKNRAHGSKVEADVALNAYNIDEDILLDNKELQWKKGNVVVKFNKPGDNVVFEANDAVDVELEKDGAAVKPSQIEVELITKDDVTFDIGMVKGVKNKDKVTLKDVLGNDHEIKAVKANLANFQIRNSAYGNEVEADVELRVYNNGENTPLTSKKLQWKSKIFTVKFTSPADNHEIIGNKPTTVDLIKDGAAVTASEIELELVTDKDFAFDLGHKTGVKNGEKVTLAEILNDNTAFTGGGQVLTPFEIKNAAAPTGQETADVKLIVRYKGIAKELASKPLKWIDKDVEIEFIWPTENEEIGNVYNMKIKAKGANTNDLSFKLTSSSKDVIFRVNDKSDNALVGLVDGAFAGLTTLDVEVKDWNEHEELEIKLRFDKLENSSTIDTANLTFEIAYKGTSFVKRNVTWNKNKP